MPRKAKLSCPCRHHCLESPHRGSQSEIGGSPSESRQHPAVAPRQNGWAHLPNSGMVWTRQSLFALAGEGHFSAQLSSPLLPTTCGSSAARLRGRLPSPTLAIPSLPGTGIGIPATTPSPRGSALGHTGICLVAHPSAPPRASRPTWAKDDTEGIRGWEDHV